MSSKPYRRKALRDLAVFTTGQAARVFGLSVCKVTDYIDGGHIRFYRVPGSSHRRMTRDAVIAFCRANDLPHGLLALGVDS